MQNGIIELDVREVLEQGRSPLPLIINTIETLEPGQQLRLMTRWEPLPLYDVLGGLGFSHESHQKSDDLWIVDFTRTSSGNEPTGYNPPCFL